MSVVRGFSLIEVLITLVVLSVGLLGAAALQTIAKKTNFDAIQRTTASNLAVDILERMRSNPIHDSTQPNPYTQAPPGSEPACIAAPPCDSAEAIAQADLYQWSEAVKGAAEQAEGANAGGLSFPTTCISSVDAGPYPTGICGVYEVTIAWRGLTPLDDPPPNACGDLVAAYDDPDDTVSDTDNRLRRMLTLRTFISDPSNPC